MKRIEDKVKEIEQYLSELEDITPENFELYKDTKTKAACERYLEKIIEAIIDLSFLIIKKEGFNIPIEDKEAFDILSKEGFISKELSKKLKEAKGMRNILAHEYGKIDDKIVFTTITEEFKGDVNNFLESIKLKLSNID